MKYTKGRGRKYPKAKTGKAIVKRINKLERDTKRKIVTMYTMNNAQSLTSNITSPLTIQKLCKFSDDSAIFGTDPNDLLGSKVLLKSMTLKIDVQMENLSETEEETQHIEMFIVQLRDEANDIFSPTNGDITLVPNIHYWQLGGINGGYAYLNKKYFKILHQKRFMLTNYGSSLGSSGAQNLDGTNFRYDCKIPVDRVIMAPMSNVEPQNWKSLVCPRDPSNNYYIIWFNDNSTLDGESCRSNCLCLRKWEKLDN